MVTVTTPEERADGEAVPADDTTAPLTRRELRRRRLAAEAEPQPPQVQPQAPETIDGERAPAVPPPGAPAPEVTSATQPTIAVGHPVPEPSVERTGSTAPASRVPAAAPEPRTAPPTADGVPTPAEILTSAPSRAGRNLPVAIGVGVGLLALFLLSLFIRKELFGILAFAVVALAVLELRTALARVRIAIPAAPILVGSAGMIVSAYLVGAEALLVAFVITAGAVVVWCVLDSPGGRALRNASAGILVVAYVPFLGSFLALGLAAEDGPWRVVFAIALAAACDTGGYVAGVLRGRHPIAPTVSPKKSWEGLAGSVALAVIVCAVLAELTLGTRWWIGAVVAIVGVAAALIGDLGESLIKRDLGMKDMSAALPGHGGMLDRVDSILFVAPVATVLLGLLAPVA